MERRRGAEPTGYVVVLLGAAAFVAGLFLPYFDYSDISPMRSASLYRLMMFGPGGPAADVGAFLNLFAGVATLAWIAIAGVRGSAGWTRPALAAVTIAWSLTWIGTLLGASGFGTPRLIGFWVLLLSVGVVMIGTIVVWVSAQGNVAEADLQVTAS
jgi:hypothetical protein